MSYVFVQNYLAVTETFQLRNSGLSYKCSTIGIYNPGVVLTRVSLGVVVVAQLVEQVLPA